MGVLPFRDSGFLDDLRRPASEDSSSNRNFCSCRFGISRRRSMDGPEPSGEDLPGLGATVASTCSAGYIHRFKRPLDGGWHGLELDRFHIVDLLWFSNVGYVGLNEWNCAFCLLLIVKTQEPTCISFPRLTATPGMDPGKYYHAF